MRSLLFHILSKEGMYPVAIAKFMRRSVSNIRDLIHDYDKRSENNKYLKIIKREVEKQLASYSYAGA